MERIFSWRIGSRISRLPDNGFRLLTSGFFMNQFPSLFLCLLHCVTENSFYFLFAEIVEFLGDSQVPKLSAIYTGLSLCWFFATFLMPVMFCTCTGKSNDTKLCAYIFNIWHPIDTRKTVKISAAFVIDIYRRGARKLPNSNISRNKIKSFKDSNYIIRDTAESHS